FVAEEEKRLILENRPAERGAELIAFEGWLIQVAILVVIIQVEDVSRIEIIIAHKLEGLAVKLIAAGARGDVDDGPGVAPVFGAVSRIVDLELLHSVDRRLERDLVLNHVVEVDAVDHEVDRVFTISRRVEGERALPAQWSGQKTVLR